MKEFFRIFSWGIFVGVVATFAIVSSAFGEDEAAMFDPTDNSNSLAPEGGVVRITLGMGTICFTEKLYPVPLSTFYKNIPDWVSRWKIEVGSSTFRSTRFDSATGGTIPSFISSDLYSGEDVDLVLYVSPNNSSEAKEWSFTTYMYCLGSSLSRTNTIKQLGMPEEDLLAVDDSSLQLPSYYGSGQSHSCETSFKSNRRVTVSCDVDWLRVSVNRHSNIISNTTSFDDCHMEDSTSVLKSSNAAKFAWTLNRSSESRTATVTFSAGSVKKTLKITQPGGPKLADVLKPLLLANDEVALTNFTTGGDAPWYGLNEYGKAARSGAIENDQTSWIETTVKGPGTLRFTWVASSSSFDELSVYMGGANAVETSDFGDALFSAPQGWAYGSTLSGWATKTITVPDGVHKIRWIYSKDWSDSEDLDAGFLTQVSWIPAVDDSEKPSESSNLPSSLTFSADGGTKSFTTTWAVKSSASWLTVIKNGDTLNIVASKNTSASSRNATLIATSGSKQETISVSQPSSVASEKFRLDVRNVYIGADGGILITKYSGTSGAVENGELGSLEKLPDWVTASVDAKSKTLYFIVGENTASSSRSSTIVVMAGEERCTYKVLQEGTGIAKPERDENIALENPELFGELQWDDALISQLWFDVDGGEELLSLPSEIVGLPYFMDQAWLVGEFYGNDYWLEAFSNPDCELRETFIFFQMDDGVHAIFVKQNEE